MVTTTVQDVEMKDADSPAEVDPAEQKKDADLAAIEGEDEEILCSIFTLSMFALFNKLHFISLTNCIFLKKFGSIRGRLRRLCTTRSRGSSCEFSGPFPTQDAD